MKILKRIIIITTFFTLYSCDKELFEDFIVINHSSISITVDFETINGDNSNMKVQPNSKMIMRQESGFGNSVHNVEIYRWFISFEVSKNDTVKSKIDYLQDEYWQYRELSDTHAEYRLVVDETHFE